MLTNIKFCGIIQTIIEILYNQRFGRKEESFLKPVISSKNTKGMVNFTKSMIHSIANIIEYANLMKN